MVAVLGLYCAQRFGLERCGVGRELVFCTPTIELQLHSMTLLELLPPASQVKGLHMHHTTCDGFQNPSPNVSNPDLSVRRPIGRHMRIIRFIAPAIRVRSPVS